MKSRTFTWLLSALLMLSGSMYSCTENDSDNQPTKPGETPDKPGETPDKPGETPDKPGETPNSNAFSIEGGRLLSENIVKYYELAKGQTQPMKYLTLVDFTTSEFAAHATDKYINQFPKSYQFNYKDKSLTLRTPRDLSEYTHMVLSIYVPEEAVGQTVYLYFSSENDNTDGIDYYGKLIKFEEAGWMKIDQKLSSLGKSREPLGWDQIDRLTLTTTGWNQENSENTTIYIENILLHDNPADLIDVEKTLINFDDDTYKSNTTSTYHKTGSKSYEWKYTKSTIKFDIPQDLTKYNGISFWVYVPKNAVNQSFYMYFQSENPDSDGMDYYGKAVSFEHEGWNEFKFKLDSFSASRSPLGWDKLNGALVLTSTGWIQSNDTNTTIYLDNFILHTHAETFAQSQITNLPGAAFSVNGERAIVDHILINASHDDETSRVYKENQEFWLPLSVFGARYDNAAVYQPASQSLQMTLNGKLYQFKGGKNTVTIDGQETPLDFTVAVRGDTLFVPASYIKKLMNYKEEYIDEMGMIYLSNEKKTFASLNDRLAVMYETLFLRPTGAELISRINSTLGGDVHPRIMLTQQDFDRLKALIDTDDIYTQYYKNLVQKYGPDSKEYKDNPVVYELTDGVRLLTISRKAKNRIIPWAYLYRMTGQAQYAMRIWTEVEALMAFPDWHPAHYLDTAEILYAMAIAFDWLYDVWSPAQRKQMAETIVKFGLETGLDRYEKRVSKWGNNNWNAVCNGGLTSAALAVVNEPVAQSAAQKVLNYAVKDAELGLFTYAPDGGYLESPIYWSYGTDYLHVMLSSLKSATGSNYGLFYTPGFEASAMFTTYHENDAGAWGFHDSESEQTNTNTLQWFATESSNGGIGRIRQNSIENKLKSSHIYDAMWYAPENIANEVKLNLDAHYTQLGTVTMRDSWNAGSILVGLHAGNNSASHGDLDIGNFILYAAGKRFIAELGSDNYNLPAYFGNQREWYYKKRAEGQNTLVIGDVSYKTPDQVKETIAEFKRVESNQTNGIAVVDMTSAYTTAESGQRGLWFKDNRSTVVLQDEMTLNSAQIVRWAVHTNGDIEIAQDGRSAVISYNNFSKHLFAEIVSSDTSLKFTSGPAVSYDPNYPESFSDTQKENDRSSYKKLMIITPKAVSSFKSAVVFKVIDNSASAPKPGQTYTWNDITNWKLQ